MKGKVRRVAVLSPRIHAARGEVSRYSYRDIAADARTLATAMQAIQQHCSCVRRDGKHDAGCFVQLHDKDLNRLASLRELLLGAP